MKYTIPLFDVGLDEREVEAASETIRSGWISMGEKTALFEKRFAERIGVRHAVAVNSGTAALHLAVEQVVDEGAEVIVPALTFVATVNAVGYARAVPVFADVTGPEDFSLDPEDVRRKITPRTQAIIVMHYAGYACDMAAFKAIADEHGLSLIEDAAHAPISEYEGRRLGSIGDIGCFSFFSNKNMACAEGGMFATDREDVAQRARLMRSHGMTSLSYDRAQGGADAYDVVARGYNYRLDDIRASIGLVQLDKLAPDLERRIAVHKRYIERLSELRDIMIPYRNHRHRSSHHIFPIVIREGGRARRDAIRQAMARRDIQTSVHYPAVHRFSIYADRAASLPNTEYIADHEITLPMFGALTEAQVEQVAQALTEACAECP